MTADGMQVDTASLRTAAGGLHATAESLATAHGQFAATFQPLIPKPGMDVFSPLISAAMTVVLTATTTNVNSNVAGTHRHASGLEAMADVHDAAESANTRAVGQLTA